MRKVEYAELQDMLKQTVDHRTISFERCLFENVDLSYVKMDHINFEKCDFRNVNLDGADLTGCVIDNACFPGSSLRGIILKQASLQGADLRYCDLSGADISGADLTSAALHGANLTDIKTDQLTKSFYPRCPEEGAFIGWKVCFDRRVVQLLVPADAIRLQGTRAEIRVNKAKVLSIKNIEETEQYEEAHSYVDENFIYRKGQMVVVQNIDMDRFTDSGPGIHIWLDRISAVQYLD